MKNLLKASLTLAGVIIGVGTFAIPYVAAQGGILIGIVVLLVSGFLVTLIHLMYGEIVSRTNGKHRLPGYAKKYLPAKLWVIASPIITLNLLGVLLIYLLVGSRFLELSLSPVLNLANADLSHLLFALIFFAIGAAVVFKDRKIFGNAEEIFTLVLIAVALVIIGLGISRFDIANIPFQIIRFDKIFLVYGVIFFALNGLSAVPELQEMFAKEDKRGFKKSIIIGTFIPVVFYLFFMLGVLGITGKETSEEAIVGLGNILGKNILVLGGILGFLATITSFWSVGLTLKKIFWYDYGINKNAAGVIALGVPLVMYFFGFTNFVSIIAVVGGVLGGIEGSILVAVYLMARKKGDRKPEYAINLPSIVYYCIPLFFALVIIYEFIY